jgi:hypothetical protein
VPLVRLKVGEEIDLPAEAPTYLVPKDLSPSSPRAGYDPDLALLSYRADPDDPGGETLRMTKLSAPVSLRSRTHAEVFLVAVDGIAPETADPDLDVLIPLWVASLA